MSRNGIIGLVVIVVIVVLGALYYFMHMASPAVVPGTTASSTENTALPSGSDTSDAAIQSDLSSIDSQMGNFGSDNASVNESVTAEQSDTQQ